MYSILVSVLIESNRTTTMFWTKHYCKGPSGSQNWNFVVELGYQIQFYWNLILDYYSNLREQISSNVWLIIRAGIVCQCNISMVFLQLGWFDKEIGAQRRNPSPIQICVWLLREFYLGHKCQPHIKATLCIHVLHLMPSASTCTSSPLASWVTDGYRAHPSRWQAPTSACHSPSMFGLPIFPPLCQRSMLPHCLMVTHRSQTSHGVDLSLFENDDRLGFAGIGWQAVKFRRRRLLGFRGPYQKNYWSLQRRGMTGSHDPYLVICL